MKGYNVYSEIQQLKEKGFKKTAVAQQLGINRRTVNRYWLMPVDVYEATQKKICRQKMLSEYQDIILQWMKEYPTISASQICDWLKENYKAYFKDRTVSRYVKELRESYDLKKMPEPRSYEAVPERPMGRQVQVDFGEKWMQNAYGTKVKVYCAGFVLAHSRYKYVGFQSRPYKTTDLVAACHRCFSYFGGMPQEMVFDQDTIVCVSENCGDIIHTYEFEKFRQEAKLEIYLCRGADPESKGMVERTVKYVKGNFLENRTYIDDATLCESGLAWLQRTANAKIHGTTKKIPAEVLKEEQKHLRPLMTGPKDYETKMIRTVRKDNTIIFNSNRYSVPLGTFNNCSEVQIELVEDMLNIEDMSGRNICQHKIAAGKGMLIQQTSHRRDRTSGLNTMQEELLSLLGEAAKAFLEAIRLEKSRYARDQFSLLRNLHERYGKEAIASAIAFCSEGKLFSANYVKDFLLHNASPLEQEVKARIPINDAKYHISTEKRALSVYAKAGAQNANSI
jgi:transposase